MRSMIIAVTLAAGFGLGGASAAPLGNKVIGAIAKSQSLSQQPLPLLVVDIRLPKPGR